MKLNTVLLVIAMIMNHYLRLRHAGRVCAADFLSPAESNSFEARKQYLAMRGELLWLLILFNWVELAASFYFVIAGNVAISKTVHI